MVQRSSYVSVKGEVMQNYSRTVNSNISEPAKVVAPNLSCGGDAAGAAAQSSAGSANAARTPSPVRNPGVLADPPPLKRAKRAAHWPSARDTPVANCVPALQAGPRAESDRPMLALRSAAAPATPSFVLASPSTFLASRDADADAEVAYFNQHLAALPRAALAPKRQASDDVPNTHGHLSSP